MKGSKISIRNHHCLKTENSTIFFVCVTKAARYKMVEFFLFFIHSCFRNIYQWVASLNQKLSFFEEKRTLFLVCRKNNRYNTLRKNKVSFSAAQATFISNHVAERSFYATRLVQIRSTPPSCDWDSLSQKGGV